ncbi:MAG: MBL fold metallo-hydrolase [Deltaproteobacteria bacterium]
MRFCVLGSGSKGNSTLVMGEESFVLIDAGFSGREIERRLATVGVDPSALNAIVISHEHRDHIRGAAILSRRWQVPVFANENTRRAAGETLAGLHAFESFENGVSFRIAELTIHPFSVSHDAADPAGFVFDNGRCRLGYCTDTGVVSKLMRHRLAGCQALVLECNHDPLLLKEGPYPEALKQRVKSKGGHLANGEALSFLLELVSDGSLTRVVLAHISETNNHPDLIRQAIEEHFPIVSTNGERPRIVLATQEAVSTIMNI